MRRETNPSVGAGTLPSWFRALCFLLMVLLIHNPYLIAPLNADGLNVSHRPSYRATVGTSELQHFSPPDNQSALTALAVRRSNDPVPVLQDDRYPFASSAEVLSPPQQFWFSGLWFRPPPFLAS